MLKINFNPNKKHLAEIENWLIDELNKSKNGFYCNWNIILDAFSKKNLCVITENNYAIGFVAYQIHEPVSIIDITEVKPTERKKGVGKKLVKETLMHFKQKGALVTELQCSSEDSESFWEKMGFETFPELPNNLVKRMFKPLVETLQPTETSEFDTTISLWDCEPYQAKRVNAKWIWNLNFMTDNETLEKPIIFPVSKDWQLEWIKNNQQIKLNKVKRFPFYMVNYGDIMIIQKIQHLTSV